MDFKAHRSSQLYNFDRILPKKNKKVAQGTKLVVREPLLLPLAALAAGILVAHFVFFTLGDLVVPASLAALVLGAALVCSTAYRMRLAAACAAIFVLGIATQIVHRQGRAPGLNAEDAETVLSPDA